MKAEFNPDGSIKLPQHVAQRTAEHEQRMRTGTCILVKKEVVSFRTPKKCALRITLSEKASPAMVDRVYRRFHENCETPVKMTRVSAREILIEIGTAFRRCSECTSLINALRECVDGNLILENGNCAYEGRKNFAYEDYF